MPGKAFAVVVLLVLVNASGFCAQCKNDSFAQILSAIHNGKPIKAVTLAKQHEECLNFVNKAGETLLGESIALNLGDLAIKLLELGAFPNIQDGNGDTPLMVSAWYCNSSVMIALLNKGADVSVLDHNGYSALMWASSGSRCKTTAPVEILLKAGASTTPRSVDGHTSLIIAANDGYIGAVKLLIEAGADPSVTDADGETPLEIAESRSTGRTKGHDEVVRYLRSM